MLSSAIHTLASGDKKGIMRITQGGSHSVHVYMHVYVLVCVCIVCVHALYVDTVNFTNMMDLKHSLQIKAKYSTCFIMSLMLYKILIGQFPWYSPNSGTCSQFKAADDGQIWFPRGGDGDYCLY